MAHEAPNGLVLSLLGPPQIRLDQVTLDFTYRKVAALLIYLALEPTGLHTRTGLAGLLWPDVREQVARQSLSQALSSLRTTLGERAESVSLRPPIILVDSSSIRLNPAASVTSDVAQFQALIAAGEQHTHYAWHTCAACGERLRAAAALYRGDFLAQFVLRDGTFFEEWALVLREQLRQQAIGVYARLAEQAEWRGAYAEAIAATRRQLTLDPWSDQAHRELMRLLARNGQRAIALMHYEQLRRTLAQELHSEPDPATAQLAAEVRADSPPVPRFLPPAGATPTPPTPMLGRDAALQAVLCRLRADETRILTISGPPGVGKTRLALAAAEALRHDFADGVWFIELGALSDAQLAPQSIALVLGINERRNEAIDASVIAALRPRHSLLILDNCEHLPELAPFLAAVSAGCPHVRLLLTSRAPLHLRAEQVAPLDPLELPATDADPQAIQAAPAVALLIARIQARQPGFRVSNADAHLLAAICARSDGLPLAIELIAAQLAHLTPAEALAQFAQHLKAIDAGPRDLPTRQQSVYAAIAWSVERLSGPAQAAFPRLAVFVGGGTQAALQAVLGASDRFEAILTELEHQNLLHAEEAGAGRRYRQLETIRSYGRELLAQQGQAYEAYRRHAEWLAAFAEQAGLELLGADGAEWSARIAAEIDNLRQAWEWAIAQRQITTALRIASGIWRFHWQRGLPREGLTWLEAGLAQRDQIDDPLVEMRALRAAGVLAMGVGSYGQAATWLEAARDLAMRHERSDDYGAALTNLGLVLREQGRFAAACTCLEEAVLVNRTMTENPASAKFPLIALAGLHGRLGNIEQAAALYAECLQLNQELHDSEGTANALYGLAFVAHARGDYQRAHELGSQSLALYQSLDHQFGIAWVRYLFGDIARDQGAFAEAATQYRQSLQIWCARDDRASAAFVLADLAGLLGCRGDWQTAVLLYGAAAAIHDSEGMILTESEQAKIQTHLAQARTQLGDEAYAAALRAGNALSLEQAGALAL